MPPFKKAKGSSSNHEFSGAMLVTFREHSLLLEKHFKHIQVTLLENKKPNTEKNTPWCQVFAVWWLNQPIWKIFVKMGVFPKFRDENKRYFEVSPPCLAANKIWNSCWSPELKSTLVTSQQFGDRQVEIRSDWDPKNALPKCSTHGLFTYIYHKFRPNVGKYMYHTLSIWHLEIPNKRGNNLLAPQFFEIYIGVWPPPRMPVTTRIITSLGSGIPN